jgi:hypothetical protein
MTTKINESTLIQMGREYPTVGAGYIVHTMRELARLAKRHHTACENACNYADEKYERQIARIEVQIQALLAKLGKEAGSSASAIFQHDPRGATVKLAVPSRASNDWGQHGLCVLA